MKKLLALLLIIPFFGVAQYNKKDANGKMHGIWVKKYKESHVSRYQGKFNHGVPVDTFVYRYESGAISSVMVFSKKGTFSRAKMYHETGYLMAKGNYINKEKDSLWVQFDDRGKVSYTDNWKKGKLHGEKVIYYEKNKQTGKTFPAQVITYKNGILEGPVKEYFPGGKIKMEANYKDDQFDGLVKKYHPTGKLMSTVLYINKVRHGWAKAFNQSGKETGRKYFYHGKELDGKALKKKMEELKAAGKSPQEW